jgi:hypothetical protein
MESKKNLIIGVIGEDDDAGEVLFKGFKEFQAQKVVLLVKEGYEFRADEIILDLDKFGIEHEIIPSSLPMHMEEVFLEVKKISELYSDYNIVINVDCDYYTSCLALSSAFVNGITAIGIIKDELIVYPVMKFSYYNALNLKKMTLLQLIGKTGKIESMEKLSKLASMSLPLIAYHLKGNRDSQGLVEMNLVETKREHGSVALELTALGKLIVKGGVNSRDCVGPNC